MKISFMKKLKVRYMPATIQLSILPSSLLHKNVEINLLKHKTYFMYHQL